MDDEEESMDLRQYVKAILREYISGEWDWNVIQTGTGMFIIQPSDYHGATSLRYIAGAMVYVPLSSQPLVAQREGD